MIITHVQHPTHPRLPLRPLPPPQPPPLIDRRHILIGRTQRPGPTTHTLHQYPAQINNGTIDDRLATDTTTISNLISDTAHTVTIHIAIAAGIGTTITASIHIINNSIDIAHIVSVHIVINEISANILNTAGLDITTSHRLVDHINNTLVSQGRLTSDTSVINSGLPYRRMIAVVQRWVRSFR